VGGMNINNNFPDNVLPFRKHDKFGVYLGKADSNGEIIEGESVGIAFLKPGGKTFRLKLWVWPSVQYFVATDDKDDTKYTVLSLDEYRLPSGEDRSHWNKIGTGKYVGNFIKLSIQLLPSDIFLCLYPAEPEAQEVAIAK
jgi:hypothetical protein